ncbi:hypothetical protein [Pedobacter aquatilis]|uniref:hypothetical protein n=1 Tax=Pedobacter aquatilis TaxID=351343 RepID=UPI00292FB10A|nr:hypothetical protein [Pedobacter aquatilis]
MIALIWVFAMLSACGTLKSKQLQSQHFGQRLRSASFSQLQQSEKQHLLISDSLNGTYAIEIWPKGAFSYRMDSGFKGEASRISISGSSVRSTLSQQETESAGSQQIKSLREEKQNLKTTQSSSTKAVVKVPFWIYLLAGLITVGLGLYYFKRKL